MYLGDMGNGNGGCAKLIETYTNSSTPNAAVSGPTIAGNFLTTLKIVGDASHRTFYIWDKGHWGQFYQESIGTFLTETTIGFGGRNNMANNTGMIAARLEYWSLTSP